MRLEDRNVVAKDHYRKSHHSVWHAVIVKALSVGATVDDLLQSCEP